jgi:dolichyl-diphosphooligosaccharide--protein glycosyltransferase
VKLYKGQKLRLNEAGKKFFSFHNLIYLISLISIVILSYILKFKDLKNFSNKENVLSCFDCYWYARVSKEILTDVYSRIDYLRNVPDFALNPKYSYMSSVLTAYISKVSGIDLNYLFLFLPPILSVLFIIPLMFWVKKFAPIHVFISAAMLGIFNFIYFDRTTLGRFDTDFLILFFVFLLIFLITLTSETTGKKSYFYLFLTGITFDIFMWWYHKPLFSILFTLSLMFGLVFFRNNTRKEIFIKTAIFILLINPIEIYKGLNISGYIRSYFYKFNESILPINITVSIAELQDMNFKQFLYLTTDNQLTVFLSFIGLFLLFVKKFRYMMISLPILLIGIASLKSGMRFIMYLAPFLGMGLGFIFYLFFDLISKRYAKFEKTIFIFGLIFVAFLSFPAERIYNQFRPLLSDTLFNDFKNLNNLTESNSYIWTWWDFGDPIEYLSERGTFVDNQSFNTYKLFFVSHFFGLKDEDKARNIIAFATNHLFKDYKKITDVKNLKEKIHSYNKELSHPVYIAITQKEFTNKYMLVIGSYSKENPNVPVASSLLKCKSEKDFYDCYVFKLDRKTSTVEWKNKKFEKEVPFKKIVMVDESTLKLKNILFENPESKSNKILEILKRDDENVYFSIIHKDFEDTIINRMYFYKSNFKNFKLIYDNFPSLVVYKVL